MIFHNLPLCLTVGFPGSFVPQWSKQEKVLSLTYLETGFGFKTEEGLLEILFTFEINPENS